MNEWTKKLRNSNQPRLIGNCSMCMGMTYVVIWLVKYLRPTPRSKRGYVRVDKAQICCGLDIGQEGLSSVYTGVVPVSSRVQIPTHHNITGISDAKYLCMPPVCTSITREKLKHVFYKSRLAKTKWRQVVFKVFMYNGILSNTSSNKQLRLCNWSWAFYLLQPKLVFFR